MTPKQMPYLHLLILIPIVVLIVIFEIDYFDGSDGYLVLIGQITAHTIILLLSIQARNNIKKKIKND